MFDRAHDARVRAAVFEWLSSQVESHGDVLPRRLLADGLVLDGHRIPLLGPQGIFKPKVLHEVPLSITTAPDGPYDDSFGPDGRGLQPRRSAGRSPYIHLWKGLIGSPAWQIPRQSLILNGTGKRRE